jgi:ABC-type multidrug transport system permease subunit
MTEQETNNSFDWVYYLLGLICGMATTIAITTNFFWIIFGGILGFIFGAVFLNGIVKGREY